MDVIYIPTPDNAINRDSKLDWRTFPGQYPSIVKVAEMLGRQVRLTAWTPARVSNGAKFVLRGADRMDLEDVLQFYENLGWQTEKKELDDQTGYAVWLTPGQTERVSAVTPTIKTKSGASTVIQIKASDPNKPAGKKMIFKAPAWYWDNPEPIEIWE